MSYNRSPLLGYRYRYFVYTDGHVRYYHKGRYRVAKEVIDDNGFTLVRLKRHWRMNDHFLHVMVANTFIPFGKKYDTGYFVSHIDGNQRDNSVENLQYAQGPRPY